MRMSVGGRVRRGSRFDGSPLAGLVSGVGDGARADGWRLARTVWMEEACSILAGRDVSEWQADEGDGRGGGVMFASGRREIFRRPVSRNGRSRSTVLRGHPQFRVACSWKMQTRRVPRSWNRARLDVRAIVTGCGRG